MKLAAQRRESSFRSRDALGLGERQPTLAESLDFIQAGDTERLELSAVLGAESEWDQKFAAQAALHLVFADVGLSKATLDSRKKQIETDRWSYEKILSEGTTGKLPDGVHLFDPLIEAYRIFSFRDQLRRALAKPSDVLWEKMVRWVNNDGHGNPSSWYSALLTVDPERFFRLDLNEVRTKCSRAIDQQRMRRPVTKDASQAELLGMLARTRLIFPDMFGPNSLRSEERRVIQSYLQKLREGVARGTGASSFPEFFYHLALIEAPCMTVDSQGIHLSIKPESGQALGSLPARSEIG